VNDLAEIERQSGRICTADTDLEHWQFGHLSERMGEEIDLRRRHPRAFQVVVGG
jgi:hypothetical protein